LSDIIKVKDDLIDQFLRNQDSDSTFGQVYTVAHAWVLFERLIYKKAIKKHNMRIYLAICLQISIKLHEYYGDVEKEEIAAKHKQLDEDIK
jgi:hypothetical protein